MVRKAPLILASATAFIHSYFQPNHHILQRNTPQMRQLNQPLQPLRITCFQYCCQTGQLIMLFQRQLSFLRLMSEHCKTRLFLLGNSLVNLHHQFRFPLRQVPGAPLTRQNTADLMKKLFHLGCVKLVEPFEYRIQIQFCLHRNRHLLRTCHGQNFEQKYAKFLWDANYGLR